MERNLENVQNLLNYQLYHFKVNKTGFEYANRKRF